MTRSGGFATFAACFVIVTGAAFASAGESRAATTQRCFGKVANIVGTPGNDRLRGTNRADVIVGLGGNDSIVGLGGSDLICGGAGRDRIYAGAGFDLIDGGAGSTTASPAAMYAWRQAASCPR